MGEDYRMASILRPQRQCITAAAHGCLSGIDTDKRIIDASRVRAKSRTSHGPCFRTAIAHN
uniref:Uncharacterized protein n=1 Tax=viral metagenome TaxID=1070528 RepID=A0A6M3XX19_9ZZZZ